MCARYVEYTTSPSRPSTVDATSSVARRLRELERENAALKRVVADLTLDNRMLKDINAKKVVTLAERRRVVSYLQGQHGVREWRACQVIGMSRSTQRRRPGRYDKAQLVAVIHELSARFPRFGYRKIHTRVRKRGFTMGRERVRVIRRREGLQVVQKQRRRRVRGAGTGLPTKATYEFLVLCEKQQKIA